MRYRDARDPLLQLIEQENRTCKGCKYLEQAWGRQLCMASRQKEKQAEQWLQKYASEVSAQVHERMDQWNKVSLEYATKMYHTAEAMSSVLDELEQR